MSVEAFIKDSFGEAIWLKILDRVHTESTWISSKSYPDKITYDLVINGADILGVSFLGKKM